MKGSVEQIFISLLEYVKCLCGYIRSKLKIFSGDIPPEMDYHNLIVLEVSSILASAEGLWL